MSTRTAERLQSQHMSADWRPAADHEILQRRAELNAAIRAFMQARGIMEVETPLLSQAAVSDPALESLEVRRAGTSTYLQTSPEFAMKRLLAAGSGPVYQIARVFRDGERGRLHHPEFTLLEWYRPGFGMAAFLDELDALLQHLGLPSAVRSDYTTVFLDATGLDPHTASDEALLQAAQESGLIGLEYSRSDLIDFLFTARVQPALQKHRCHLIHDYPVVQAALARIRPGTPAVAERFELFIDGMEIGNGFNELRDAAEQRARFQADQAQRERAGLPRRPLDERLLGALKAGLPDCCGMAIGLDRLLMALTGARHIDQVLAFPIERA